MAASETGWDLLDCPARGSAERIAPLVESSRDGTIVLWELLRTGEEVSEQRFLESVEGTERHLAMTFHRMLDGDGRRIRIRVNGQEVRAWDPFLSGHPSTQHRPEARIGPVRIKGFVLPHRDRFRNEEEHDAAGGPEGWVAQQGFYVYRAQRLLVAGGWLGLGGSRGWLKDEASQLARIRIDIPNTTDVAWRIDVRKATARPPAAIRDSLARIALDIRRAARDVYAHRYTHLPGDQGPKIAGRLWQGTRSRRFPFGIKRDHPAVQAAMDATSDPAALDALILALERSVPIAQQYSTADATVEENAETITAARALVRNYVALGLDVVSAAHQVCTSEPFDRVAGLEAALLKDEQ